MNNFPIENPLETDIESEWPLATFNTFNEALFSVFVVLANDEWINIMSDHYRAVSGIASVPFFMSLLLLGQYILLNLFLAILLENFDEDNLEISNEDHISVKGSDASRRAKSYLNKINTQVFKKWTVVKDWLVGDDKQEKARKRMRAKKLDLLRKKKKRTVQ
jgi:hypothetical protein